MADGATFPWSFVDTPAVGHTVAGHVSWPDPLLAALRWPYIAKRGERPGHAVAIVAAVHGGEYPSVLGAQRLGRLLDATRLAGALLILPIVNLPAFWERSAFVTPVDGRDLDHLFPGRAAGTFSERLAFHLTQDVLEPADAVLDVRAGNPFEALIGHIGRYDSGATEVDRLTRHMAAAFGLPYAVNHPFPERPTNLTGNAARIGKPCIYAAIGGNGLASDDVQTVFQGLINTLRVLGMLGGQVATTRVDWLAGGWQAMSPLDGLWQPAVALGQSLEPDELLGTLRDPLGEEIARVVAEQGGLVLSCATAIAVRRGERLVAIKCPVT